jgi:thioredoxin-dependent peroxiredoxin
MAKKKAVKAKKQAPKKKKAIKKVAKKKAVKKAAKKKPVKKPVTNFKQHITSLKADDAAPFFVGHDQHGNQISLNDFTGKTLVLYFYPKDDTSGCTTQSCSLRDEYKYLTQENFAVVGVSADNVKSHKKFADKFSLPFPLLADVDMEAIKAYDVWGKKMLYGRIYDGIVRTTFIIRDGIIVRVITDIDKEGHGKQVAET